MGGCLRAILGSYKRLSLRNPSIQSSDGNFIMVMKLEKYKASVLVALGRDCPGVAPFFLGEIPEMGAG